MRDTVTFRNRFTKSKGVKSEGKAVKNPDAAGLQRLKGEVASGGQEDADKFEQMAKSLISSGGGVEEDGFESSFMGANLHNLRVLAEDESEESDDQAPEVSEKDAKSMAGSSTSKGPLAKVSPGGSSSAPPQPVDERQVADECSKAQRLWRKGITSMADNFTELQSQAMEVLREAFPNRMNQHLRNAFGVCDLRSAFGRLVAGNQSDELAMLIAAFKDRREVPSGFLFEQPEVGQLTGESASQQGDSDEAWTTWSEYAEHRLAVGGDAVPSTPGAGAVEAETAVVEDSGESGAAAEKQRSALEAEWQKLVDNPKLARDNGGLEGALRLKIEVAQKANTGQQVGAPERAMNKVVFTPMKEKPDRQAPASNTLKRVPPCRDFEDLRTAEDLLNMADVYEEKDTVDDIREFTKQLLQFKTCARGMYVSWKASVLELEKAIKGWKLANEQSEKDAVKAKARAAKEGTASKRKQYNNIMDIFMEKGVAMQTFDCRVEEWLSKQGANDTFVDTHHMDMTPYIVTGLDLNFTERSDCEVAKSLEDFCTDFATSTWRTTAERAMRVCLDANRKSGPADDFLLSFMAKYCPQGAILAPHIDAKSVLRAESCLCNFGLKQGSFHVAVEKSGLWTARLSTKGTRAVVVVDIDDVKEMMKKQSLAGKDCKAFMKDLGVAGASDYVNSGYKILFWHNFAWRLAVGARQCGGA